MLRTILRLAVVCMTVLLSAAGRGANTGADQLDGGYWGAERHVHGAAGRDIQKERLGCRAAAYRFELARNPSDSRRRDRLFLYGRDQRKSQANLKGANIAFVAGATNRQVFSLMAKPEFKRITDLRGKKIGITRVGSSTHTSALVCA